MKKILCGLLFAALSAVVGCSKEEVSSAAESAKEAVSSAAESAKETAGEAMESAKETASGAMESAKEAAGALAGDDDSPADLCRSLAEKGAWDEALEVCREALALSPDDPELQDAVQQAEAAAE